MVMNNESRAEEDVRAFLEILKRDYGITPDDLRWMANYHRTLSRSGSFIAKTVAASAIGLILTGLFFSIFEGIKHIIHTSNFP